MSAVLGFALLAVGWLLGLLTGAVLTAIVTAARIADAHDDWSPR